MSRLAVFFFSSSFVFVVGSIESAKQWRYQTERNETKRYYRDFATFLCFTRSAQVCVSFFGGYLGEAGKLDDTVGTVCTRVPTGTGRVPR